MSGGTVTPTLTPAQILAHLNALGTSGALFDASVFALKDPSAPTKIGKFSAASITAGQTRTYTLPDANIVLSGSAAALTSGRVPFATTGGLLTDSANLTWNGSTFAITGAATISTTLGISGAVTLDTSSSGLSINKVTGTNLTLASTSAASATTAGGYTSTVATGTAPFTASSTTVCPNLNASLLLGSTWAAPGTIGSGTPSSGAFTTISASGQITSTVTTGTAPLVVASTTVVANLNASLLLGSTWAAPGSIGSGTPAAGAFTTLAASGVATYTDATDASALGTASVVLTGGLSVAKAAIVAGAVTLTTASSGLTISKTTGTTLTVSSTATVCAAFAGGATFGNNVVVTGTFTVTSHFVVSSAGAVTSTYSNAGTTDTPALAIFDRRTSGTPAAGFGLKWAFLAQDDTGTGNDLGNITASWATVTHASRKARVTFSASDASDDREYLRGEASGAAPMIGFLGANASVRAAISGSRGGNAALASLLTELAAKGLITDSTSA